MLPRCPEVLETVVYMAIINTAIYGSQKVGEQLQCKREVSNVKGRYAIAVVIDEIVVGHLPMVISLACSLFIRRGIIKCEVTGGRRYSSDLPQGGLEIPCILFVEGRAREVKKLLHILDSSWPVI